MNDEKNREGNGSGNGSMERYITGELRGEERAQFEEDVLADEARSEDLYQDVNVHAALVSVATGAQSTATSRARTDHRPDHHPALRKKRGWTIGAAVAVAAAAVFAIWTTRPEVGSGPGSSGQPTEDGHRFRSETVLGGFDSFAPRGVVTEAPTEFSWAAEPTAARYRIRIEKSDGTLLHEGVMAAPPIAQGARPQGARPETVRYAVSASGIDWSSTPAIQWNVAALDETGALIEASPWQPVLVDSP